MISEYYHYETETIIPPQDYENIWLTKYQSMDYYKENKGELLHRYVGIIENYIGNGMSMAEISVTMNISYPTVSAALSLYFKKPNYCLHLTSKV